MDSKFMKATKGRDDEKEIFRKLDIKDTDKFSPDKLRSIEVTVKALESGDDMNAAAKKGLAAVKTDLTVVDKPELSRLEIPPEMEAAVADPITEAGKAAAWDAVKQMAEASSEAQQNVVGDVRNRVTTGVYSASSAEMQTKKWQEAAAEAIRSGKLST